MPNATQILAHTADIRIKVTADTLPNLFDLALKNMNRVLLPEFKPLRKPLTMKFRIKSPDTTSMIVDFLSEVLSLSHIHKALFVDLVIDKMTDRQMSGSLKGAHVREFEEDIKAVTYHEADVKVNEEGDWETVIIFDI